MILHDIRKLYFLFTFFSQNYTVENESRRALMKRFGRIYKIFFSFFW